MNRLTPAAMFSLLVAMAFSGGCQSPAAHRRDADRAAAAIIAEKQVEALGKEESFSIEPAADTLRRRLLEGQNLPYGAAASLGSSALPPVPHWPEASPQEAPRAPWEGGVSLTLELEEALQVGARNSREYQRRKEDVFQAALSLELERDEFRNTFAGILEGFADIDGGGPGTVSNAGVTAGSTLSRGLASGAELTGRIAVDLVKLLTQDRSSSYGLFADATVSIPLLRGTGRHIAAEPLRQAERDTLYAIWSFERFKREFAVRVTREFLSVLQAANAVSNAEESYRGLGVATRRAERQTEAGRLPRLQYDQSRQNELAARNRWIRARESFEESLDGFKNLLGLPTDADITLDASELERLAGELRGLGTDADVPEGGRADAVSAGISGEAALRLALENRLDLRIAGDRVEDAQRAVVVAADALRGELTLLGSAQAGGRRGTGAAGADDAVLDLAEGRASAILTFDPAFERTAEGLAYRASFIALERAVRDYQETEERVKLEVRSRLRNLRASGEGIRIQALAVAIAEGRVKSTDLFLQAGRAQIRDLLESTEALVNSRNAFVAALVSYRVAELELQRDLGILEVNERGLWKKINLQEKSDNES